MDAAIIGAVIAGAVALVSIIVNAVQQKQQSNERAAERLEARTSADQVRREDAENQRLERRYEDRLRFQIAFLEEADRLIAQALDVEFRQYGDTAMLGPPAGYTDEPEHDTIVRDLRAALSHLDLVSGSACRKAAGELGLEGVRRRAGRACCLPRGSSAGSWSGWR